MDTTKQKFATLKRMIKLSARIGTGLCIMILVWSCATIPGLKDEEPSSFIRVPFVRVLLGENQSEATFSAQKAFAIECLTLGQQAVYHASRPITVYGYGRTLKVVGYTGLVIQEGVDEVNIIPRGTDNRIRVNDNMYRGIIQILPHGQNIRLVNIVYMEDYLRGVVPPEIGKRTENELEAVKAQAVTARTYAMAHLQQYPNEPFDLKSSVYDQVYEGARVENKLVNKAIDATAGIVASYQDKLINAYYHSTCGGMTDDISQVWDRQSLPYLKPVADNGACSWSKYYSWKEVFTEKQLRGRIEQYMASDRGRDLRIGRIRDIKVIKRTPGGRVATLAVYTDTDIYRFYRDRIRWVIGRTSNPDLILPSDKFDVYIERDNNGRLQAVTFKGSGYGHGIGMCQCGAIGMSREGWTFDKILKHYYKGIDVEKLY